MQLCTPQTLLLQLPTKTGCIATMVLSEWRRASATHRGPGSPGAIGLAGRPAPASIGDVWQGGWISLRQSCDNAGVVAASHKGISLKQPLASVLQSLALYAARHKLQLRISHVAGSRNEWADVLSRRRALDADFFKSLDPGKQLHIDWSGLLSLCRTLVAKST